MTTGVGRTQERGTRPHWVTTTLQATSQFASEKLTACLLRTSGQFALIAFNPWLLFIVLSVCLPNLSIYLDSHREKHRIYSNVSAGDRPF